MGATLYSACMNNLLTAVSSAMSSATNALTSVIAAALLTGVDFGAFSLTLLLAVITGTAINSLTGEAYLSAHADGVSRAGPMAATLILAILIALCVAPVAWIISSSVSAIVLWGLVIAMVPVSVHAAARSSCFATGRFGVAVALDAVWLLITIGGLVYLAISDGDLTPNHVTIVWALGALIALLATGFIDKEILDARSAFEWTRTYGKLGGSLAFGSLIEAGSRGAMASLVGSSAGYVALGALRLMETLFGLCTVFFTAARARAIPLLSGDRNKVQRSTLLKLSIVLSAVPLTAYLMVLIGSPVAKRFVEDELWTTALQLALPVAVAYLGSALVQPAFIVLRVTRHAGALARCRTIQSLLTLVTGYAGLRFAGVHGAAWGVAIGQVVGATVWWVSVTWSRRRDFREAT